MKHEKDLVYCSSFEDQGVYESGNAVTSRSPGQLPSGSGQGNGDLGPKTTRD